MPDNGEISEKTGLRPVAPRCAAHLRFFSGLLYPYDNARPQRITLKPSAAEATRELHNTSDQRLIRCLIAHSFLLLFPVRVMLKRADSLTGLCLGNTPLVTDFARKRAARLN